MKALSLFNISCLSLHKVRDTEFKLQKVTYAFKGLVNPVKSLLNSRSNSTLEFRRILVVKISYI